MTLGLQVTGDLDLMLKRYRDAAAEEIEDAVRVTGLAVMSSAVKSIQRDVKTGRTYVRRGVAHTASAPGQAPASDTGRLAGDINAKHDGLRSIVGTRLRYGRYLEFGTMDIFERPWLRPAIEFNRQFFVKRLTAAIRRARA